MYRPIKSSRGENHFLRHWFTGLTLILAFAVVENAAAEDFIVSDAAEISAAMNNASAGDFLIMTDGIWTNESIDFAGNGTATQPITLRAQTLGGVQLTGGSQLSISGSHLVVEGLNFESGGDSSLSYVVQFRGSLGEANNCRLTNSQIRNYNPPSVDTRYHWVRIFGQDNRVDHCTFQGHDHSGVTIAAELDNNPARHLIDSNAFLDRPEGNGNGFETIRIGTSSFNGTSAQIVVENNLFQRLDGEIEIISNKSADNVYRYNTFRDSAGTLTLRHGKAATVAGNFFLGMGRDRSGGIRVVDEDHTIVNNYIADIDDRADGAISLVAGIDGSPANGYQPVRNVLIQNNTIVNVQGAAVKLDWGLGDSDNGGVQDQLPENVQFTNNLISSTNSALFEGMEGSGWTWNTNIVHGAALGIAGRAGLTEVDPQLVFDADGLWRPDSTSPAIDGGTTLASVTDDMDGQARIGMIDIGADEVSSAAIVRKPLTTDDVGIDWSMQSEPTGQCVILQAESFTRVTDPNDDGDTWQIIADDDALGGSSIEAPSGSRTDLSSSPHDALAMYDVSFSEAGQYTAYYRAYGTNGSTNSFYSPTAFDIDPTVTESTSSDGIYAWVTGEVFTITESDVGIPLELRLGRREASNRVDAIVFHQDSDLTDAELDALFSPTPVTVDVIISGGDAQRSMLLNVDVTFSGDVQIGSDAFSLLKRGDGIVELTVSTAQADGNTTATLSFSGSYTEASGSLVDGNYQLSIDGANILDSRGKPADIDGDGNPGGIIVIGDQEADAFYRFFGDIDQNRTVNIFDLLGFRQTYLLVTGDASFDVSFDSNLDGVINIFDLLRFRENYLATLLFDDSSFQRKLDFMKPKLGKTGKLKSR